MNWYHAILDYPTGSVPERHLPPRSQAEQLP